MGIEQQIRELEEEIKRTPYNKATEHHIGRLKAKLARLREEAEKQRAKTGRQAAFSLKKEGDATAVLIGYPSVGKSTILNRLTGAKSEVADYDFTTLKPVPGILNYKGAAIQIIDVPGIVEGASKGRGRGKEVISAVRVADLIIIVADVFNLHTIDVVKKELYEGGIRLDQSPPDIVIRKKERGGVRISSTVKQSIDESTIMEILREYRIHSADVVIREEITIERLIDALAGNRVYIPSITVVNKIDLMDVDVDNAIKISAEKGINLDLLKEEIYRKLDFIRIFLKPPGGKADMENPMILRRGATVEDICRKLHRDFIENFRYAKVWGKSVKFHGQRVGLDHVVMDGDTVTIYA
ncbi:OBG GTPase family GTP-binding protein [Archaeoglobus neptunius]|uniref:OBG GTPase family GTP-binding protein n=1 Tax=Archaeoglobus neptunius TaxID=2798580 RepID=UPI001927155E|nr:GTP-binding protein [Archaeoglobus neptunius]